MKEINISFKELIDYIKDKDFEIMKLKCNLAEVTKEKRKLEEEKKLVIEALNKRGLCIIIEAQTMYVIEKGN